MACRNGKVLIDALHLFRSGGTVADVQAMDAHLIGALQLCDAPLQGPDPSDTPAILAEARAGRLPPLEGELPRQCPARHRSAWKCPWAPWLRLPGLPICLRASDTSGKPPSAACKGRFESAPLGRCGCPRCWPLWPVAWTTRVGVDQKNGSLRPEADIYERQLLQMRLVILEACQFTK